MARLRKVLDWFVTIEDEENELEAGEAVSAPEADTERPDWPDERSDAPESQAAPAPERRPQQRVVDMGLDPYAGELDEQSLASPSGEGEILHSFAEIYGAAGLSAEDESNEFTIFKVEDMLGSSHVAELSTRAKAASVMVALEATGVSLQSIIQDAIARDKALDQYEAMKRKDLKELEDTIDYDNALIQAEIEAYLKEKQDQIRSNKERVEHARRGLEDWLVDKSGEEQRLFDTVSAFVEENPITRG